jgi:hypothetical protein
MTNKNPTKPPKDKSQRIEDRFIEKFDDMMIARENQDSLLFDELVRSIRLLLKLFPTAYQELNDQIADLDKELDKELNKIEIEARQQKDTIDEDAYRNNQSDAVKWQYRDVVEELILDVLYKYGLIGLDKRSYNFGFENP